jgi:hypothetical protein
MSRRSLQRLACAAAVVALGSGAGLPARAQTSAEVRSRVLFDQARALAEAGKYSEACPLFQASHDLHATGGNALQAGNCYEKIGKLDRALAMYQIVVDDPKTAQNPERMRIATERVAALKMRLQPAAPPVAPPPATPSSPPAVTPSPPSVARDEADASATKRLAGYVLVGAGGAGVLVGAVAGGLALAQAKQVTNDCHGSACPAADKPAADAAMTKGWVSNISLGVGVAAAAVGAVLLIVNRAPSKTVTATAEGLTLHF